MKKTLAFDVYGTLINTNGVLEQLQELIGEKAVSVMEMWRSKQLEYSFRKGLMGFYTDFSVCTKEALLFSCAYHKINLTQTAQNTLLESYQKLPAFADAFKGLKQLQQEGHRIFAFSNGSKKAVEQLLEQAQLLSFFEAIVSVENIEVFKPSPLTYTHFLESTKARKEDSWLISSNSFDVLGAKYYGMQSVWVQRSANALLDPWGISPNQIVKGIDEIKL